MLPEKPSPDHLSRSPEQPVATPSRRSIWIAGLRGAVIGLVPAALIGLAVAHISYTRWEATHTYSEGMPGLVYVAAPIHFGLAGALLVGGLFACKAKCAGR